MSSDLSPLAYNEARLLREHFRLIYGDYNATAFVFDPGIAGPTLQTWLATPANNAAFAQLCATYIGPAALIANTTTWAAVIASSTAMAAVIASSTAMAAVIASSTAMAAVIASSTAMAAVAASSTAMAAVAASSTAMAAVIASSTAMAAVIASSTAMAAVAASSTAMAAVAASSTAVLAIFAVPAAKSAFKASTALSAANVPTMTGPSSPSGTATASTTYAAGHDPWRAFDKVTNSHWYSASGQAVNQWVAYQFPVAVYIHTATVQGGTDANTKPREIKVQYSDDGVTWVDAMAAIHPNDQSVVTYDVLAAGKHTRWRLLCISTHGANYAGVAEFDLRGFTW